MILEKESVLYRICEEWPDCTFAVPTEYTDAVIGMEEKSNLLILSMSKVLQIIIDNVKESGDDLTEEEVEEIAWEHYYFNVEGSSGKNCSAIYCWDLY